MSDSPAIIKIVTAAIIKNRKLLQSLEDDSGGAFYVPGGTIENGESDIDCLKREIKEELGVDIVEDSIEFLHEFEAPAHGRPNTLVNMRMYKIKLAAEPNPCGEVLELRYFDSKLPKKYQAPITGQIFDWLTANNYVD
jgi:8-oxo-dGTP pyrophosphatase MutT (NUDIX family)